MIKARHIILVSFLLFFLFGCGALPKPFHRLASPSNPLSHTKGNDGVRVTLLVGTTKPMSRQIATTIIQALVARKIPANLGLTGKLRYILSGRIESKNQASTAKPMRVHWHLSEINGTWLYNFTQNFDGSIWEGGFASQKVIDKMGEDVAVEIANILVPEYKSSTTITPKMKSLWLMAVNGASGDEIKPLARAMRFALKSAKIAISKDASTAKYFLKVQLTLTPIENELQILEVHWTITSQNGKKIGRIVQRNTVPVEFFDKFWGETAILIATAAVPEIKNLLIRAVQAEQEKTANSNVRLETKVLSSDNWPVLPPPELSPEPDLPSPKAYLH